MTTTLDTQRCPDKAAIDVSATTLVRRPVVAVAAHATDLDTRLTWLPHVLGRRLPVPFEVVETAGNGMVLRTGSGALTLEAVYTWVPRGTFTEVTLRTIGAAPGAGLASSLIAGTVRRAMARDLTRLTAAVEKAA